MNDDLEDNEISEVERFKIINQFLLNQLIEIGSSLNDQIEALEECSEECFCDNCQESEVETLEREIEELNEFTNVEINRLKSENRKLQIELIELRGL